MCACVQAGQVGGHGGAVPLAHDDAVRCCSPHSGADLRGWAVCAWLLSTHAAVCQDHI